MSDIHTAQLSISLADLDAGTLLPSMGIATIFLDAQGRVKGFTPAAREIWPMTSSHIGRQLESISHRVVDMPPLPDLGFLIARTKPIEHEVRTGDGRWYLRTVLPRRSRDGHAEGMVITFVDITQRKRAEVKLVVEHAVTRLLADAESFRDVANDLLKAISVGLDVEFCALWMLKRRPDRLSCFATVPGEDVEWLSEMRRATRGQQYQVGEGLPGRVWASRSPEWVIEPAEHPDFRRAESAMACGLVSGAAFPILVESRFLGVIEFFSTQRLTPQRELQAMMESIGNDIGDFIHRRQLTETLRAMQVRYSAILESSLDCIITMDHEGKIADFNPAAVRTLGFAAADVIGRPLAEILVPERFRQQHIESVMQFLASGAVTSVGQRLELIAQRADGSEIPVEVAVSAVVTEDGTPFFTGFLRDISDRKQEKQRQLKRQKIEYFLGKAGAELSESLDPEEVSSRVAKLCVPGLADWALLDLINDEGVVSRADVAYGDPAKKILAQRLKNFPPSLKNLESAPARALFNSESVFLAEFTETSLVQSALNAEHEAVLRELSPTSFISVPLTARGATFGALTLIRANSTRRYAADDVQVVQELAHRAAIAIDNARLYQQAEQANRAKSDFLANMSHEIRTPMTAVLGYADILAARVKDPVCSEKIGIIKRNGKFLLEIINDILDLSKIEAGRIEAELERFEVAELVGDVLSLMNLRATDKGLELLLDYQTDVPEYILSDPIRLRQILVNLIGNAIKFTETGTVKLVLKFDRDNRRLLFDVVDTGIGVSPELQSRLFEPFNQGDTSKTRKYGGTGLGLTISRRLAQMLGGTITIQSEPGAGSTFTVEIDAGPVNDSVLLCRPEIDQQDVIDEVEPTRELNCRVLIVDDREDIRTLAQHFVVEAGGRAATACDGVEAIAAVHEADGQQDSFDLILMDMQMPNLDGREATTLLRTSGFRQPIIAMTADAMQGDREKTIAAGCDAYLSKPIDRSLLTRLIASCTQDLTLGELEERRRRSSLATQMDAERWLDTAPPVRKTKKRPAPPQLPPQTEHPRVLIVDDWPDTSAAMGEFLEMAGFETRLAETAQEGIDTYLDWQPAAVLMDLGLPDMNGCHALRRMRQCAPLRETYFVAITGREDDASIRRARKAGFQEYIVKPVDINEIVTLLQDKLQLEPAL